MRRAMRWCSFVIVAFILLAGSSALAEGKGKGSGDKSHGWGKGEKKGWENNVPPGIEKKGDWMPPGLSKEEQAEWKNGRPPGWSHGEKEGWKGADMPPGLAKGTPHGWKKWNNERKQRWERELVEAKEKARSRVKKLKGFSKEDLGSALVSIEAAARKGVPIRHARGLVEKAMEKGIRGRGLETASRAMAYGVGKEIDFEQLGVFIHRKLNEGLRGDELSIEIYKEIADRHEKRLKAKELIQQEKKKGMGR